MVVVVAVVRALAFLCITSPARSATRISGVRWKPPMNLIEHKCKHTLLDAAQFPPTLDQRCYIRELSSRPVMLQEISGLQYR